MSKLWMNTFDADEIDSMIDKLKVQESEFISYLLWESKKYMEQAIKVKKL